MPWQTPLDADVPVRLSRANADRTRRQYYLVTGAGRDDVALPKLVPPGWELRWSPSGPANDYTIPAGGATYDDKIFDPLTGRWLPAFRTSVASRLTGRGPARVDAVDLDQEWYDTAWGREEVVSFFPPLIRGQYGWEPNETTVLADPEDLVAGRVNQDTPPLVAVLLPHPYIVGLPEPLARIRILSSSGRGDAGPVEVDAGIYLSPVILTGRGDRHRATFYTGRETLEAAGLDAAGWWQGRYTDVEGSEWWQDALRQGAQSLSRSMALQMLVTAIGSVVTFGAGGLAIQALIQSSIVSSASGAIAGGSPMGLVLQALTRTPSVDILHPTSPGELFAQAANPFRDVSPGATPLEVIAQAPTATVATAAPEQTNVALAVASEASVYLDSLGSVAELYNMSFRELTIRAQQTQKEADELRIRLAELAVDVKSQAWYQVVRRTIDAVQAIALAGAGKAVAGAAELIGLATLALSGATTALRLLNVAETLDALSRQLEAENEAAQHQLAPGMLESPVAPQPAAPTETSTPPTDTSAILTALIGAIAGAAVRGPAGAIAGGALGFIFGRLRQ